jgi:valyl-tRNA synthetase
MTTPELPKNYDAAASETSIYERWLASGFFNPDNLSGTPFTIMMPPPNATGILHLGHALGLTIQDIIIRFRRMQGYATLWLPGTDHAAIATQARVEKDIQKTEGKSRHDLGRDELLHRIDEFVEKNRSTMAGQMRVIGASCDWSREAFTLDAPRSLAVRTIFKRMYDDGLIYRGNRIVNWDPKGQTTISDDEIEYQERPAKLYTFRYSKDFPIPISTTRPETKVGDVAVAVHPDDERYRQYVGTEYDIEFCGVPLHITVVADAAADPAFGTGAVGVTPAHSMTDADIARRHNLPAPQVISEYARMIVDGPLKEMKVIEAREAVVAWLKEHDLLEKEESVTQSVATAERTGGIIEPLPKLQWFIDVNKPFGPANKTLKDLIREAVAGGDVAIIPEHFSKTYFHWIDNLRDWCISRQIWYGHRIPVWYRNSDIHVGEAPSESGWTQDEDTLDTWFSSGLWTFSTLGWPEKTPDLKRFHPTDILVTAYEILFFWVARMILMTGYALQEIPFRTVYLTGIIRDAQGRKFSKSLGNGIDPIQMTEKFGADAVRMALVVGNTPGTDSRISEDKIKAYKHFANKLWNIARYVLANTPVKDAPSQRPEAKTQADTDILDRLDKTIASVTENLGRYVIHEAANQVYQFAWHELADVYIEASKKDPNPEVLLWCLVSTLKLAHPFMPFVTEELWSRMFGENPQNLLMVQKWPA